MKLWILVIIFLLAAGCGPKKAQPALRASGEGVAVIQTQARNAEWNINEGAKVSNKEALPYLAGAKYNVKEIQKEAGEVHKQLDTVSKLYNQLLLAYDKAKWVGWKTRTYIYTAISAWLILGILGIVSGINGYMGLSKFLMRLILLANPFVWIRDGILSKRNTE